MFTKGFALIEIVILITVIGLIGSVVVWQQRTVPSTSPAPFSTTAASPPSTQQPTPQTTTQSQQAQSTPTVIGPVTPKISQNVKSLPTTMPYQIIPFSGTTNEIQVGVSKTSYNKGETIEITITNQTAEAFSYHLGPGCGIFFERKVSGQWTPQSISYYDETDGPCLPKTIQTKESHKVTRSIDRNPPSGTYRVHFQFINDDVYSSEFLIL